MQMIRFKDFFSEDPFHNKKFLPSVSLSLREGQGLNLKFDQKDSLVEASYFGKKNVWFSALCSLIEGKTLSQLLTFSRSNFDLSFKDDPDYWEHRDEIDDDFFSPELELLHATIDHYRGRDHAYTESSSLICRCFGIREEDVRAYLRTDDDPSIEKLTAQTKAGGACRSCVPQLKRWLLIESSQNRERVYKDRTIAEWLLEIDYMLSCFPLSQEWGMQVESFKNRMVVISFKKSASQREEEEVGAELQRFLAAGVDEGLSFFLRRS